MSYTPLEQAIGTLSKKTIPWMRFLAEAAIIVSSVYLAIVLEGASADRGRRAEAVVALTALRAELELDHADAVEILALQARKRGAWHRR